MAATSYSRATTGFKPSRDSGNSISVPRAFRAFISWTADCLPYSAYGKNYLHMLSRSTALERYFESNFAPWFLRRELLQDDWMLPADSAYLTRTLAEFLLPGKPICSRRRCTSRPPRIYPATCW